MYNPELIMRSIEQHNHLNTDSPPLVEYPIDQVRFYAHHFENLTIRDQKERPIKFSRNLVKDEIQFIHNERQMCAYSLIYFAERYIYIEDVLSGEMVLFRANLAQRAALIIIGQMQLQGVPIRMLFLKARQLGVSTLFQIIILHRMLFMPSTTAIVASGDEEKTRKLVEKMVEKRFGMLPWWLVRPDTVFLHSGDEFMAIRSAGSTLVVQHGRQKLGIARGDTSNTYHFSEILEWNDYAGLVEQGFNRAIHDTERTFGVEETTASPRGHDFHRYWEETERDYPARLTKIRPVFLPYFVGRDIYPAPGEEKAIPVPEGWEPPDFVKEHAASCEEYARTSPVLRQVMPMSWKMDLGQQWWYYREYTKNEVDSKRLAGFLAECVDGDARISTDDGILRLSDCKDALVTETGDVTGFYPKGPQYTVDIKTKHGRELSVTPDHLIAGKAGNWIAAADLKAGDVIKLSPPMFADHYQKLTWDYAGSVKCSVTIDEEWGRLLGYFMGDGCFNGDTIEFAVYQEDADIADDIERLLAKLLGLTSATRKVAGKQMFRIRVASTKLEGILNQLGCLEYVSYDKKYNHKGTSSSKRGQLHHRRCVKVPEVIWRSPKSVVKEFISALFECDGHANRFSAQITFFTKDPQFALDVQLLLLGFDINCLLMTENKTNAKGYEYIGRKLRLNAEASDMFHERVGFISKRKNATGKRRSFVIGRNAHPNLLEDKIVSVTNGHAKFVFDITVAKSHCFGANGILVHNCPSSAKEAFQSWQRSIFSINLMMEYQRQIKQPVLPPLMMIGPEVPQPSQPVLDPGEKPLQSITYQIPGTAQRMVWQLYGLPFTSLADELDPLHKLWVWELPQPNQRYVVSMDCAEGIGQDRTVIEVVRLGNPYQPAAQVAEYATDLASAFDCWSVMLMLLEWYSPRKYDGSRERALGSIEMARDGVTAQNEIFKRGWPNLYIRQKLEQRKMIPYEQPNLGWETNQSTRAVLISWIQNFIKRHQVVINSPWLLDELRDFVTHVTKPRDGGQAKIKIEAGRDAHDDRIMALAIGLVTGHELDVYRDANDQHWIGVAEHARKQLAVPDFQQKRGAGTVVMDDPGSMLATLPIEYAQADELANPYF